MNKDIKQNYIKGLLKFIKLKDVMDNLVEAEPQLSIFQINNIYCQLKVGKNITGIKDKFVQALITTIEQDNLSLNNITNPEKYLKNHLDEFFEITNSKKEFAKKKLITIERVY